MINANLTIPGTLPGLNEYISAERTSKYKAAAMKKEAEKLIDLMIKTQMKGIEFQRPVIMHYWWFEPNKKRDKDNISFARKFVQDSLVRNGVLANDGWSEIERFDDMFSVDEKNPRVEIYIEEYEFQKII
jgi:Holliday junction resolvase RusA-like endonuclease